MIYIIPLSVTIDAVKVFLANFTVYRQYIYMKSALINRYFPIQSIATTEIICGTKSTIILYSY